MVDAVDEVKERKERGKESGMPVNIPPRAKRRCGQLEVEMEASAVLGEDSLAVANNELAENLHSPILSLFVIRH